MEHEIHRANGIISDLLDFSKENVPNFVTDDLNVFLEQIVSGFESSAAMQIDLQLDENLPVFAFDHSQMERVFNNLIQNGRQAMPEGGIMHIRTSHDDSFVQVAIRDSGHGIAEDDLAKIFDPLFTTKASGVGLGLSIVKDWVEKHHGSVEVSSVVDKGTIFTVQLPIQRNEEGSV